MTKNASASPPLYIVTVQHSVETVGTSGGYSSAVGVYSFPKGTIVGSGPWRTSMHSVAEIRQDSGNVIAVHYGVDEYGVGETVEEAVQDLLTSLVDYRASLEKREDRLADKERSELAALRVLLERQ